MVIGSTTIACPAPLAEIDPNYISQIERGVKNVSLPFVWKLAKALGIKPSELVAMVERKWRLS